MTSALESNVGLNAIAQWTSQYNVTTHQGLGTGSLYENNIEAPLILKGENMSCDPDKSLGLESVLNVD